jgi:LPXTG-motif cell wall-anchored protein
LSATAPSAFDTAMGDRRMRRPVRLPRSLAVVVGALLVAGLIAAPALAGHAKTTTASARRTGNDHAHSTAKAWKSGEWASDRRPAKAWRKGGGGSARRPAKSCPKVTKAWKKRSVRRPVQQCETVSPGSVVRTAPVLRQTAQPTTTAAPTTTREPTPPTYTPVPKPPPTRAPTTTTAPTTICEPTTSRPDGSSQLPSTGSSPAHLLIAGLLLGSGGLTILFGARSRATVRGTK